MLKFQKGFASGLLVLLLLIGGIGFGTYLVQQRTNLKPQAAERAVSPRTINYGWDYNLSHRCIKSVNPSGANYFKDLTDCPIPNKNWTIAVQTENQLGISCSGVEDQSLSINSPQSPASFNIIPHTDEFGRNNWSVNLKTNVVDKTHPCGSQTFTWYIFMDKVGPFPKPNELMVSSTLSYNDYIPNGASRGIFSAQFFWDDTSDGIDNPKAHDVEIAFSHTSNWGDNFPNDYRIAYDNNSVREFIYIEGAKLNNSFISADNRSIDHFVKNKDSVVKVNWYKIIQKLIKDNYLHLPINGLQSAEVSSVAVGMESHNFTSTNAVITDLWFTNLRVENKTSISTPYPIVSPTPIPTPSLSPSPSPLPSATATTGSRSCQSNANCPTDQTCTQVLCKKAPCPNICL